MRSAAKRGSVHDRPLPSFCGHAGRAMIFPRQRFKKDGTLPTSLPYPPPLHLAILPSHSPVPFLSPRQSKAILEL
jgi:hypothetical protein